MNFKQTILITSVATIITFLANIFFHILKNKLNWFENTKKFIRDYSYCQLKELYLELYSIIVQSEYLRYFFEIKGIFEEYPFIEIEKKRVYNKYSITGQHLKKEEGSIEDAITEFNKCKLTEIIINKREYASQELLKMAVAYRYVNIHYLDKTIGKELLEKFQKEEVNLIGKIVKRIVKETNEKLKVCNMNYNEIELKTGIINYRE